MASNQVSNQRRPTADQGSTAGRRTSADYSSESSSAYSSLGEVRNRASEYAARGQEQMREYVRGREGTAIMVAVAAGLGVGVVIGAVLGRSHRQTLGWRDRIAAEGFGRRLMERMEGIIPEAIAEHFAK
jgi:hypothetical protein